MGAARRFACDQLAEWDAEHLLDTVSLLVSELVTNALLHARTDCDIVLDLGDRRLRVEVHDGSTVGPSVQRYDDDAATGRGMLLIEALAAAWGARAKGDGKLVWFEVDRTAGADATDDAADLALWDAEWDAEPGTGNGSEGSSPAGRRDGELSARARWLPADAARRR